MAICSYQVAGAGKLSMSVSALPHLTKLRLILFVSLVSAFFSLLVLFLNISHLHALLPIDYSKMVNIEN